MDPISAGGQTNVGQQTPNTSLSAPCSIYDLPMHITARIFYLTFDHKEPLYLVSKTWAALKTNPQFYQDLYTLISPHIFNKTRFQEVWGDPGPEPKLPLKWMLDFNPEVAALTLVPEKIIRNGTGKVEYLRLENLVNWMENPTKGHPLKFGGGIGANLCMESRMVEATHWVWITRMPLCKALGTEFSLQEALAKKLGGEVAGLVDLSTTIASKYNTTGDRFFPCDIHKDNSGFCIRVKDLTGKRPLGVYSRDRDGATELNFMENYAAVGVILVAMKSFGVDENGKDIPPSGSMHPEFDSLSVTGLRILLKQAKLDLAALPKKPFNFTRLYTALSPEQTKAKRIIHDLISALKIKLPELASQIEELRESSRANYAAEKNVGAYAKAKRKLTELNTELETLVPLYEEHKTFLFCLNAVCGTYSPKKESDFAEIDSYINRLREILATAKTDGYKLPDAFKELSSVCVNPLENFLYDYIADQFHKGNRGHAQMVELLIDSVEAPERFIALMNLKENKA